jgi:hypothetical protein
MVTPERRGASLGPPAVGEQGEKFFLAGGGEQRVTAASC